MDGSSHYPVVLMHDRFSGVYSGGEWLAVAEASEAVDEEVTRAQFCLVGIGGPSDGDVEAAAFWMRPPDWIAVGATPEAALESLNRRLDERSRNRLVPPAPNDTEGTR